MKPRIVENDHDFFCEALLLLALSFKVGFDMLGITALFKHVILEPLFILATGQTTDDVDTSCCPPMLSTCKGCPLGRQP